jgi:hypothetical protein
MYACNGTLMGAHAKFAFVAILYFGGVLVVARVTNGQ